MSFPSCLFRINNNNEGGLGVFLKKIIVFIFFTKIENNILRVGRYATGTRTLQWAFHHKSFMISFSSFFNRNSIEMNETIYIIYKYTTTAVIALRSNKRSSRHEKWDVFHWQIDDSETLSNKLDFFFLQNGPTFSSEQYSFFIFQYFWMFNICICRN